MSFFWQGVRQGWDLIARGDPYTLHLIWVTLRVAGISTGIAVVIGLPVGLLVGLGVTGGGRSHRSGRAGGGRIPTALALTVGNAGLSLPPVVVGLVLSFLMFPAGPLGRFHLLNSLRGVEVAQTVLALPIVAALSAAAFRSLPAGLLVQARALGAHTGQVWLLAVREARVGVLAAIIAALGSAVSEVGAVTLVGGNIQGDTQTLASAALLQVDGGHFGEGMAIGIVLLGLILILAGALTAVQVGGDASDRRLRRSVTTAGR